MAEAGDEVVCVLSPSDREVNLKKLAAAAGEKQGRDGRRGGSRAHHRLQGRRHFAVRAKESASRAFIDKAALGFRRW